MGSAKVSRDSLRDDGPTHLGTGARYNKPMKLPVTKEIPHSFLIHSSPGAIADASMQEPHIQQWWAKEARSRDGIGVLG
jgi:hypothetical protein